MANQTTPADCIAVHEERLVVTARAVESGRVTVTTSVKEHDETVEMLLRQQNISVDRVAINRVVEKAPEVRQDGDTLIVPVMEEILVVEKRLVLREEIHIRTTSQEQVASRTVRLRTDQVDINETGRASSTAVALPTTEAKR